MDIKISIFKENSPTPIIITDFNNDSGDIMKLVNDFRDQLKHQKIITMKVNDDEFYILKSDGITGVGVKRLDSASSSEVEYKPSDNEYSENIHSLPIPDMEINLEENSMEFPSDAIYIKESTNNVPQPGDVVKLGEYQYATVAPNATNEIKEDGVKKGPRIISALPVPRTDVEVKIVEGRDESDR